VVEGRRQRVPDVAFGEIRLRGGLQGVESARPGNRLAAGRDGGGHLVLEGRERLAQGGDVLQEGGLVLGRDVRDRGHRG